MTNCTFIWDDITTHQYPQHLIQLSLAISDINQPIDEIIDYQINQPATLILTSGSSGQPKAVLHHLAHHLANARGSGLNLPFGPGDRWLLSLPLYHVGGLSMLFKAAVGGATLTLPAPNQNLFESIQNQKLTHISLVATQLYRLLQEPTLLPLLRQLKAILLGGSAIPAALIESTLSQGLPIHTSYGSSEMGSQISCTPTNATLEQLLHSSGRVLAERELKIDSQGQIWVRGATRFVGYFTATGLSQPFDTEGWFATGDLGQWINDEWIQVLGRQDNMFISGGENIQPEEIEHFLLQLEPVIQAFVVPIPDAEFGQRPVAFVETQSGIPLAPGNTIAYLRQYLPGFKIPRHFLPWPNDLPVGLKVSRKVLRAKAIEKLTFDHWQPKPESKLEKS